MYFQVFYINFQKCFFQNAKEKVENKGGSKETPDKRKQRAEASVLISDKVECKFIALL